tara:strand:- start:533 stop:838 length:306 start_codon:yes stop_codon:yes gene_type:complete
MYIITPTKELLILTGILLSFLIAIVLLSKSISKHMKNSKELSETTNLDKIKEIIFWWAVILLMMSSIFTLIIFSIDDYASKHPDLVPQEKEFIPPADHSWR